MVSCITWPLRSWHVQVVFVPLFSLTHPPLPQIVWPTEHYRDIIQHGFFIFGKPKCYSITRSSSHYSGFISPVLFLQALLAIQLFISWINNLQADRFNGLFCLIFPYSFKIFSFSLIKMLAQSVSIYVLCGFHNF